LVSNYGHVLNVVFFSLGDFAASELYLPTLQDTVFHLHRQCKQEERAECSEMSANKIQTLLNRPKIEHNDTAFVLACVCGSHAEQ